jgi:hypothetical protein
MTTLILAPGAAVPKSTGRLLTSRDVLSSTTARVIGTGEGDGIVVGVDGGRAAGVGSRVAVGAAWVAGEAMAVAVSVAGSGAGGCAREAVDGAIPVAAAPGVARVFVAVMALATILSVAVTVTTELSVAGTGAAPASPVSGALFSLWAPTAVGSATIAVVGVSGAVAGDCLSSHHQTASATNNSNATPIFQPSRDQST